MSKKATIILFILLYYCLVPIRSQNNISTNIDWKLAATQYPTPDAFVYAFSVDKFGAKADGVTDNTSVFQKALDQLKTASNNRAGGVLFVPAGKYVIKGNLNIPKGVTLRGEWKKPEKGHPIEGTILMAYAGRNMVNGTPFISMEPAAGVRDLAIWYPEQTADGIVPYPVSIVMGKEGYFGNNFCNVRNITLVNSYQGIATSKTNGGGCPVFYDIYGSPLFVGIEIDRVADVGRLDRIHFSPDYWSESGLEGSPSSGGTHARWMYEYGTGIMMRRNDWSYTCYVHIDGYNVGFNAAPSNYSPTETGAPNGHNYEITFTNCKTAVRCDALSNAGILFSRIHISGCENGFTVSPSVGATLHLMNCDISATRNAIYTDSDISTRVMMQSCRIDKGNVTANG